MNLKYFSESTLANLVIMRYDKIFRGVRVLYLSIEEQVFVSDRHVSLHG